MHKVYYQYDPAHHLYRRVYPTYRQRVKTYIRNFIYCVLIGGVFTGIYILIANRPKVKDLKRENKELSMQYSILEKRINNAFSVLSDIQHHDDNMYRVLMGTKPADRSFQIISESDTLPSYQEFLTQSNRELIEMLKKHSQELESQLYIQSNSFAELAELIKKNEDRLASIPAIQPLYNKNFIWQPSGYGYRIDPIYHTQKFHAGIDFAVPKKTPVYATGNGTVTWAAERGSFGNLVVIDHGYGYTTRYAHLDSFKVKKGDKVVRGQVIALSGSTGKSTGPHLHYEVLINGKNDNPANYFFKDLDADQYLELMRLADNNTKVFD